MAHSSVLVIDLGLSSLKVSLFTVDGRLSASVRRAVDTRSPQSGWFVQDPDEWWLATIAGCRELMGKTREARVAAIAVTGHMHTPVFVSSEGRPVSEAPVVWDRRTESLWPEIAGSLDLKRYYKMTGGWIGVHSVPAKLLWFSRNAPQVLDHANLVLAPKDFLKFRLTGHAATDPTDAAGFLLFNIQSGKWIEEVTQAVGLRSTQLPPVVPSTTVVGSLGKDTASLLNVPMGTPVVAGAGDDVEALGLGAINAGDVYEHLGSTGTFAVVTDTLVFDPEARVETMPHPYPGRWIVGGSTNTALASLDRLQTLLRDGFDPSFLLESMAEPPADKPYFLPYLSGERSPRWDQSLRGAFLGLDLATEGKDLLYAALEGVAFSLRDICEVLRELELPMSRIFSSGGGASIRPWASLRASVYQLPILTQSSEDATSRGAFLLAGLAMGMFSTVEEVFRAIHEGSQIHLPHPEAAELYEKRYQAFKKLVALLTPWFRSSYSLPL